VLSQPGGVQKIRALPARAGSVVAFSHRTIHWGSGTNPRTRAPRISMAFACSDPEYEAPYLRGPVPSLPPLGLRVALAASQAINYHRRLSFDQGQLALFHRIFSTHVEHFDPGVSLAFDCICLCDTVLFELTARDCPF
jgi:hypothetical protein